MIIDFQNEKDKREISPECYSIVDGVTYYKYIAEYRYNDEPYGIEIWATSLKEAEDRLLAISLGYIRGQVFSETPLE